MLGFLDHVFSSLVSIRFGFFELQLARDKYRELCGISGMHVDLVFEYIRRQALVISPICPHMAGKEIG